MEVCLSKAAEFLKKTDAPISEISSMVGFHQMSNFGKRFREKTGYSPKEYRAFKKLEQSFRIVQSHLLSHMVTH